MIDLHAIADNFRQQPGITQDLDPYDCKTWIDPLALWSNTRIGKPIDSIILLLDWRPSAQIGEAAGTVEENVKYCEDYFTRPWNMKRDITFAALFWCVWSRHLIESGSSLVMNAVWGVRKKELTEQTIATAVQTICSPIFEQVKPKTIYACHEQLCWRFKQDPRAVLLQHPSAPYNAWAVMTKAKI